MVEAARCDGVRRSSRRVGGSGVASRCLPATVALRDGVGARDGALFDTWCTCLHSLVVLDYIHLMYLTTFMLSSTAGKPL